MKFNVQIILNMVAPYLANNTITRDEFGRLFAMLSRQEQSDAADILSANGITLRDDESYARAVAGEFTADPSSVRDQLLYDNDIFGGNDPAAFATASRKGSWQGNELLAKAAQEGNSEALELLFRNNKALVMDYALQYTGMYGNDLDTDDLYSAGCCGLMEAVERFNYDLGYKFTTYAVWWIRQAIFREIENNGYTIRIPCHMQERMRKVSAIEADLIRKGVPSTHRVAVIAKILRENGVRLSEEQVSECIQLNQQMKRCASLDMPVGVDGDTYLGDFIPAGRGSNPEDMLDQMSLQSDMAALLRDLSIREEKVIVARFGLDGQGSRTLEEIGSEMGVTRERIRQIEAKALRKLKTRAIRADMAVYLEEIA